MKKVLFILHKKNYDKKYILYMKILKLIGYKIHILTNINEPIKYCDKQQMSNLGIFDIKRKINKDYEMIFCNTKIIKILAKIFYKKIKNKIVYINNKNNLKTIKTINYNNEFNITKEKYIFCSIVEFNNNNNQIMQLEVMIRIIKKYPESKLLLIGKGKLKEYYEHIIEKYGLSNNAEIIEKASDSIDIVKKSDCIISTRKKEEFALDSIMAIILNKPIIASNVGINKLILKSKSIFYNSEELKEKMITYIEENKKIERYYYIDSKEKNEILKSESI